MKTSTLMIPLLAAALCGKAQIPAQWIGYAAPADYQSGSREAASGVDTSGNIYTAGSAYDSINDISQAVLVKYSSTGAVLWKKFYNDNDPNHSTWVVTLLVDKTGNSYLCGYGYHGGPTTKDFMLVKYDNAGTQLWAKYWDGGQNEYDYSTCATFDAAGNIVVAGYANTQGTTWDDLAVLKYSTAGVLLWSYQYNNSPVDGEDRALDVCSDNSGNIFVTGSSYGTVARDMLTIKLNSSGVNQWTKRIPHGNSGDDDRGYSVATDVFGNAYVTGAVNDWITIKYDPSGAVLWTSAYTDHDLNRYETKKVMIDRYGSPIVAGNAFFSNGTFSNLVVNKLNPATGATVWTSFSNYGGIDNLTSMALDTLANIYICGYFEGPTSTDLSAQILSPSTGLPLWSTTYANAYAAGSDQSYQVVVDKNRNVILTGVAERRNRSNGTDIITLKYGALVTGINEQKAGTIAMSLYPNPARSQLFISTGDPTLIGSAITVQSLSGQIIREETIIAAEQVIDLSAVAKGMYLVTVSSKTASVTKKLVIE